MYDYDPSKYNVVYTEGMKFRTLMQLIEAATGGDMMAQEGFYDAFNEWNKQNVEEGLPEEEMWGDSDNIPDDEDVPDESTFVRVYLETVVEDEVNRITLMNDYRIVEGDTSIYRLVDPICEGLGIFLNMKTIKDEINSTGTLKIIEGRRTGMPNLFVCIETYTK